MKNDELFKDTSGKKTIAKAKLSPEPSPERRTKIVKKRATPPAEIVDSEETWDINLGGTPSSIKLALDEANLRDADGNDSIVRLIPPATQETLPDRLAQLTAPGGVFPVAYLVGEERSVASRRIITPDLRVQLSAADVEKIALQNRLKIKDLPDYAPGWAILTAADAFAALDAMVNLRTEREVSSADVLLAAQKSLRALPNDPLVADQWHLKDGGTATSRTNVNIESAWNYPAATGSRGTGIRIGIVDDGMQTNHPDLVANADTANDYDWNGVDTDPSPGTGDDHGTACAGNAAARGNNSIGVSGTAPLATLVGMRLIAAATTDAQEAEALNYLPDLIQIKSNSWGPNDTGSVLEGPQPMTEAAIRAAATTGRNGRGNIIVWAAGNGGEVGDNSNYDGYANSIYTIAIGATDSAGNRASYSEPGSNVIVCAPSSGATGTLGITTVDRTGSLGYNTATTANGGDYTNDFGGTSSATPTAAGIIALILEKNPNLGWRDVQEILIRSAFKFKPTDSGWATNAAGIAFNHNFGAGLIDASAAVNLAATWTNLAAQTSVTSTQTGINAAIPNNNSTGVTRTFNLSASNIRVEHVTLKLSATHTARGNLDITLTSPSGMVSKLAEVHGDTGDNYSNWTFSSVRNWGELSTGTWTLKIADLSSTGNTTGGTLTAAELTVFGTPRTPANPPPLVQITQPTESQVFSPGTQISVIVSASDLTAGGAAGTVSQVQVFDNNVVIATLTAPPYSFTYSPAVGAHTLIAKATDSEGALGSSTSVNFTVVNQAPTITAASLSATGQNYTDTALKVTSVNATDPENSVLTFTYQWQSSTNQTTFTNVSGATSDTAPALAGSLLRCVIKASDGNSTSVEFTTAAVNQLLRPTTTAATDSAYSYTSGLVLRGTDSPLSRQAIIHEFSQGVSGSSEWIEILTLKSGSFAFWDLSDAAGNILVFRDSTVWDNIPAGTLIVVYNGASKDSLLPADDLDPSDGNMVVSSTNSTYFDTAYDPWIPLGNSGDSIFLSDPASVVVHSIAYGNSVATTPNIGSVGSGKSAYFSGDTDAKANIAANWRVTTSLTPRAVTSRAPTTLPIVFGGPWSPLPTGFTGSNMDTPYSTSLGGDTAIGSAKFGDQNDSITIEFTGQAGTMTYRLKGNAAITGDPTAGTFAVLESANGTTYTTLRTVVNATATDTAYTDTPASTTRFIRFIYQSKTSGNIQLDKLSITAAVSNALTLNVTPTTFAENLGAAAATGTVSISAALGAPLTVALASSDTSEATVPDSVIIAAGQTSSPTFQIAAVDDLDSDGPQSVTLTASAPGYTSGTIILTVTDNEASVEGVTPAAVNNAANNAFVAALRNGSLNSPALFRIGAGAVIPSGLTLATDTGILSGTIAASNPAGNYLIVIERYNTIGETVSQSYTLTISTIATNTYATWINNFPALGDLTALNDDFDGDGLPNGIENFLGTSPASISQGISLISATSTTVVFRHTRSNTPATDLSPTYEWSADLTTWNASGAMVGGTTVSFASSIITDTLAPANDLIEVTATLSGTPLSKTFVRIKTVK